MCASQGAATEGQVLVEYMPHATLEVKVRHGRYSRWKEDIG